VGVRLARQVYGKSNVRLTKVTRHAERHDLIELVIDVSLEGDFAESYLAGDNRHVIPTDTMKNTVYVLAADSPLADPESFCLTLAAHFLDRFSHVAAASITAKQTPWQRIESADTWPRLSETRGSESRRDSATCHRHSFIAAGPEQRTCAVRQTREGMTVESGLTGLALLKTTDSAFRDFLRDEFTTLRDADDRIFAGHLDARWTYTSGDVDWNSAYTLARAAMIGVFADHKSLAVQQTLFAMGSAALEVCPEIERIELSMSNEHRVPVNLEPFGRPNRNEIFVTTTEPFGVISAVLEREGR
jgi:urate oxidase